MQIGYSDLLQLLKKDFLSCLGLCINNALFDDKYNPSQSLDSFLTNDEIMCPAPPGGPHDPPSMPPLPPDSALLLQNHRITNWP